MGDHRLVGGDHVLAVGDGALTELESDAVGTADQFDDHVGIVVTAQVAGVVVPAHGAEVDAAVARPVAGRDGDHLETPATAGGQQFTVFGEQANDADADRAKAGNCNLQGVGHGCLIAAPSGDG